MFKLPEWNDWMVWGALLMLGFPMLVVWLSELAFDLRRMGKYALLTPLDLFRNSTLFLVFITVLLRVVVDLPGDHLAVRLVDTALWITLINLALAIFNALFFSGAEGTWRAQAPKLLIDLCRVFIVLVCAAFIISQIWGLDLKAMLAALGVGSLVIGLALQDTLGNLFSGIAVVSARQFRPGDWIKVGDIEGQVRSINWRSVSVATSTGDLIIIPNGQIARERLRNFGADKGSNAILIDFKLPNDQAPQPILDLILKTAATTANVMEDPKPVARIVSYDDADVTYRAIVYIKDYKSVGAVKTEFLANFWYGASRQGIRLPPRPVVIQTSVAALKDGVAAAISIADRLTSLGIFHNSRRAIEAISAHCRFEMYRKGQSLIKSGEPSSRFFVIAKGNAAAYLTTGSDKSLVEEFAAGELVLYKQFFRHHGCPFDVEALSDVETVSIPVQSLAELLATDADLSSDVERLLSLREEAAGRKTLSIEPNLINGKTDTSHVDILREMFRV